MTIEDEPTADPDAGSAPELPHEQRIERERRALLDAISASRPLTTEQRVAWVLNNYPNTRNSDIDLQIRYWETFHPGQFDPDAITYEDLRVLPRLTSISRARARVQNTFRLFLADDEVRRHRGTLSEDEREKAREEKAGSYPVYAVYADESGKTQEHLIVGSLWILQGPETLRISLALQQWRSDNGFFRELHFKEVSDGTLGRYKEAVDIVLANAAALGFKYVSVPRAGSGGPPDVVPKLLYHLLVRGVEHEDASGRAPLPRNLQVWKDAEEPGYDAVVVADLKDRLHTAAGSQFSGRLAVDIVEAADSKSNDLLQIADLFTASVNRVVNPPVPPPRAPGAKDELAGYILGALGLSPVASETVEDLAVKLVL